MKNLPRNRVRASAHRGFTLIEILIVLAIGAGILFAVFLAVSKVQSKALTKEASESLNLMVADTRALYRAAGTFAGITPQVLINNNVPPTTMVPNPAAGQIISPWNTVVDVEVATINTANDAVLFRYNQVPRDDCSNFVTASAGSFNQVTVGGTLVKDASTAMALNVATLGTQCNAGNFSNIEFIQGR